MESCLTDTEALAKSLVLVMHKSFDLLTKVITDAEVVQESKKLDASAIHKKLLEYFENENIAFTCTHLSVHFDLIKVFCEVTVKFLPVIEANRHRCWGSEVFIHKFKALKSRK